MIENTTEAYRLAQRAMADLKSAVHAILASAGDVGFSNAQIGRTLGIYGGHVGHEGHIPRTILAVLEGEGVALQDESTKHWRLRRIVETTSTSPVALAKGDN